MEEREGPSSISVFTYDTLGGRGEQQQQQQQRKVPSLTPRNIAPTTNSLQYLPLPLQSSLEKEKEHLNGSMLAESVPRTFGANLDQSYRYDNDNNDIVMGTTPKDIDIADVLTTLRIDKADGVHIVTDKCIAEARKKIPGVKYVNQIAIEGTKHVYFCEIYRIEKSAKEKEYNKRTKKTITPSANALAAKLSRFVDPSIHKINNGDDDQRDKEKEKAVSTTTSPKD